jgi:ubiquitin-like protein Pup
MSPSAGALDDDVDAILDEIDDVLETNAGTS